MAKLLRGKEVADALSAKLLERSRLLTSQGVKPTLALIRVGERPDDVSYERSAMKRAEAVGISVKQFVFGDGTAQEEVVSCIRELNVDASIHGVLIFRPLPGQIDDEVVRRALAPEKDIDGITDGSMSGVYSGANSGFPPCTPTACMEILDYYGVETVGKRAVVVGRSLVVGKPAALMLIKRHATVTVCHTKTANMQEECRKADILLVAAGRAKAIGAGYLSESQVVIDVGINVDDNGKLCGDVDFAAAEGVVGSITPVPGGVGAVTSAVLMKHVIEAAERVLS